MNIYIPIVEIGYFLLAYVGIGILALVPLSMWQNRFIYGHRKWHAGIRWPQAILQSMAFWPFMLGWTIKEEIRLRRKGVL